MINPRNIQPEKSLYVIGATIISVLKESNDNEISPEEIYEKFSIVYPIKISYNYFIYSLDWLYIINLIDLEKNKIKKCF
jgi:hypothetical protein